MDAHPVRAPFHLRMLDAFSAATELSVLQTRGVQFAAASLALVLVVGTGTAYAAESALPGDALYTIKVNVEEPIQGALATSPQAKAQWSAELATRRLSEAETLAAQGKLTPQAASAVTTGLDQATTQFDANVAEVATSSGDQALAVDLQSNMQATLAANTQVLQQLQSAVPRVASSIAHIISKVRTRTLAVDNAVHLKVASAEDNTSEGQLTAGASIVAVAATDTATTSSGFQNRRYHSGEGISVGATTTSQTAAFDARVEQLRADIAWRLHRTTGIELSPATSSEDVATSSIDTSFDASTTAATSSEPDNTGESDLQL